MTVECHSIIIMKNEKNIVQEHKLNCQQHFQIISNFLLQLFNFFYQRFLFSWKQLIISVNKEIDQNISANISARVESIKTNEISNKIRESYRNIKYLQSTGPR